MAPASVLWIFGRCIVRSDLPDLRRWLVARAFAHWRAGRSLNPGPETLGKRAWFERALAALGPEGTEHRIESIRLLRSELETLHPGKTGRRSIHGTRRRQIPDPDLLLIDDVCHEVLTLRGRTAISRDIEWTALAFCITNVDLRWQLTAESAPRLRELADWFAARAARHEADAVRGDIESLLEHARGIGLARNAPYPDLIKSLVDLPADPATWREQHLDRLDRALAYLRLRHEGFFAVPFDVAARMHAEAGGDLAAEDWFNSLHDTVEDARRNWRYWERVARWRQRLRSAAP